MIEIIIGLIIIAIGFLPIYNLFRQGSKTTVTNVQETVATNYASDLINFCKDFKYYQIEPVIDDEETYEEGEGKDEIKDFISKINADLADNWKTVPEPYVRKLTLHHYKRKLQIDWGLIKDLFTEGFNETIELRTQVPCYSIKVTVTFPRMMSKRKDDKSNIEEVILESILID